MDYTISLATDLPTLTAEIHAYKRVAGEAIFEIGRRLKDVRDRPEKYGLAGYREWERWCVEEIDMSRNHANKFIKVFEEFGASGHPNLGIKALYEIATLPAEERERPHTIPSTGEAKRPDEMTVRELREVKAALKAEREAREKAEADYELVRDTLSAVRDQPERIEYVEIPDRGLAERLRRYEQMYGDIDAQAADNYATNTQDLTSTVMQFCRGVREFAKRYAYVAQYSENIRCLDAITAREYAESLRALRTLVDGFPIPNSADRVIIDLI